MSGDDGVDGFVLSIALAYNDIKGIDWLGQQMENCRPTDTTTVSAGLGQWNGIRTQVVRFTLGLIHEILHCFGNAHAKGVLNNATVRTAIEKLTPEYRERWKQVVAAGNGKPVGALRQYLRNVRNTGAFHYNQSESLLKGYRDCFVDLNDTEHYKFAYVSIGRNMEGTRFYFADAAAQRVFVENPDVSAAFEAADRMRRVIHGVIHGFVMAYALVRSEQLNLVEPAFPVLRKASVRSSQ
jgi:hypothetical protein